MKNPLKAYINYHKERWNNDKAITQATLGMNPYLAMAALVEIIYFATDALSPVREALSPQLYSLVTRGWHGLAIVLAVLGLLYFTPFGRKLLGRKK